MLKYMSGLLSMALLMVCAAAKADLPDFTELIEKNSPAVVKIEAEGRQLSAQEQEQMDMLRRFFGRRLPEQSQRSMGSGFIVSEDGYVLTNNHVVGEASKILVRLNDRDEYTATVVGTDPNTDLALLKIDADNLPTVEFGDSEALKVGEWVVAIGSPFGLDYSAAVGIVSAIGRDIPGENFVPFIQSDVAINPGNSGGPLFNLDGEVVGINSQIYTRSGGSNGISFSIPAHVASRVVQQLKEHGVVERGWFGISMNALGKEKATELGLDKPSGALVTDVHEDSPAQRAGLKADDVIIGIAGKKVDTLADLSHIVSNTEPGTKVAIKVVRDGKKRDLSLVVGKRPSDEQLARASGIDQLGLETEDVDQNTRAKLRLNGGVVVTSVQPDTAAALAGLQQGDVIVRIGNLPVADLEAYQQIVEWLPKQRRISIRFYRNGRRMLRNIIIR